jgi:flagellin
MGLRINTNVEAYNSLRNFQNISNKVATSIERLSSGMRINRAADDPAGLIISESLRAQIDGMTQAVDNSQNASNLIKTAEGALTEVNQLLRDIRQLAVHAANTGVNDQVATQADQTQIASALSSIQRIAEQTQFGNKKLLDGTSGISASVVNTSTVAGMYIGGTYGGVATQTGTLNITVNNAATRAQMMGSATFATVNASLSTVNGTTTGNGGTVVVNGQSISLSGSDTVQTLIDKINEVTSSTGVSAAFTFGNGSGMVVLKQNNYGANHNIRLSESSTLIVGAAATTQSGLNATVTVTASGLVNGAVTTVTTTFSGGRATGESGLKVTDTYGNSILLTEAGNATTTSNRTVGTIISGNLQFQLGANSGQTVSASLGNIRTSGLGATAVAGSNLSLIDVTTATGASNALLTVDEAISQVSQLRSTLGALQKNTLDSTVRYLGVGIENLSASESQIRDTNVASEVVNLTKNQIIQSAAQSVLAQANAAPQSVLSLLR